MKNIVTILVLIFLGTEISFGQKPSLLPMVSYGKHTTDDFRKLFWEDGAKGEDSVKGVEVRFYITGKLQEGLKDTISAMNPEDRKLDNLLQDKNLSCEEVTLKAGTYQNSGWDWNKEKIVFFIGDKDLTVFVWVFRMGSHKVILCKSNCLNILNVFEQKQIHTTTVVYVPAPVQQVQQPAVQRVAQQATQQGYQVPVGVNFVQDGGGWTWGHSTYGQQTYNVPVGVVYHQQNYGYNNNCCYPRYRR